MNRIALIHAWTLAPGLVGNPALRPPHKPRRRVSTITTTDGDAEDEHGADLVGAAHLQLREPAYSPKPPTPRHRQTRALEIEQEGACDQLLNYRFGTPLQRVLAAAIYGALETRAERHGMSPGGRHRKVNRERDS